MPHIRFAVSTSVAAFVAATIVAACSSGSGSTANKTAFCQDNATLATALGNAKTQDEAFLALKAHQSEIDDYAKTAPAEIKSDAQKVVTAARAAISSNDITPFIDPGRQAAGHRVASYCGQNNNGTS